jgi:hypothetical protein
VKALFVEFMIEEKEVLTCMCLRATSRGKVLVLAMTPASEPINNV